MLISLKLLTNDMKKNKQREDLLDQLTDMNADYEVITKSHLEPEVRYQSKLQS